MAIRVAPGVQFKLIPVEMLDMFYSILNAAATQGVEPVITGAAGPEYPDGKVHDAGYAIDVRSSNLPSADTFAADVATYLGAVSPHYKVLYGDAEHTDHIHIGFAWWYSRRESRRRL